MTQRSWPTVSPTATLREATEAIGLGGKQIVLVEDDLGLLVGTLTDGDVRRALLRGLPFDTIVAEVMNHNFRALSSSASDAEILAMMRHNLLHQIPLVDGTGRTVRLAVIEDLVGPRTKGNRVVLMAGGKGTRLGPLTSDCPKPMLPVAGKPMLQIILEQCADAGFHEFSISINYLGEQIKDHFGDGSRWGVRIDYIEEPSPLGTAGALGLLQERPSQPMLVMNGDVLTRVDLSHLLTFHEEQGASATMCVRQHKTEIPFGVVRTDDLQLLEVEEKPAISHFVNAGIYVIEPHMMDHVASNEQCDMPELLRRVMLAGERVIVFPIYEYWIDIGRPETLAQADGEWE